MKIIRGVGERLLPAWIRAELRPILTVAGAGTALLAGTRILAGRLWAGLGEHLDQRERWAALAIAGYVAAYSCWRSPDVARFAVPAAVLGWCLAAWWTAPPASVADDETAPAGAPADGLVQWLLDLIGDRPGIHLRDLYPAMRRLPGHEHRDDAALRAALKALGIPVQRSLRIGKLSGRSGVARAALEALPCRVEALSVESGVDAGQDADSPAVEPRVERLESA